MTDAADEDPGYGDKRWRKWGLIDHDGGVMEKYSELIWVWRFYYKVLCVSPSGVSANKGRLMAV